MIDKIENLHPVAQFAAIIMLGLVIITFILSVSGSWEDIFKSK